MSPFIRKPVSVGKLASESSLGVAFGRLASRYPYRNTVRTDEESLQLNVIDGYDGSKLPMSLNLG
jgi:hypothetical protein